MGPENDHGDWADVLGLCRRGNHSHGGEEAAALAVPAVELEEAVTERWSSPGEVCRRNRWEAESTRPLGEEDRNAKLVDFIVRQETLQSHSLSHCLLRVAQLPSRGRR